MNQSTPQEKVPLTAPERVVAPTEYLAQKRWTRDEYQIIFKAGLLQDKRYELIEGCIAEKMGQDRKHVVAVMRCQKWLSRIFGTEFVQSQGPALVDTDNEPEPDIAVFKQVWEAYSDSPPASDALLFVEVTNTTQTKDRQTKRTVYARNGVPEYWILDTGKRTLTVHREPLGDEYAQTTILTDAQSVTPLAAPEGTTPIPVSELFAPVEPAAN
jgi:Uma2 family endonuclease